MAIKICPYKAISQDNFQKLCTKGQCPLWNEYLEMCSHKAASLLLFDIHQVVIKFGQLQELIPNQKGDEDEKS
jgi:hypothetical protein